MFLGPPLSKSRFLTRIMGTSSSTENAFKERVTQLIDTIKTRTGSARAAALQDLWNLSNSDEYKQPLCNPTFQLLPTIKNILENNEEITILNKATGILWFLSRDDQCNLFLIAPEVNLLPVIMRVLQTSNQSAEYRIHLLTVVNNMCLLEKSHDLLLSPHLEWLSFWKREMLIDSEYFQWYRAIANFAQSASNQNMLPILEYDLHRIIFRKLVTYPSNPHRWVDRQGGIPYWCITFAANLSAHAVGKEAIHQLNELEYFLQLMQYPTLEGIRATILVANVYGRDENNHLTTAILVVHEAILSLLLDLLQITINYDRSNALVRKLEAEGFSYGTFKLRTMASALKNLSISDENKKVMIRSPRIIQLSMDILQDFVENKTEYSAYVSYATEYAGGGGNDFESIELILELLLQLSFYYDDNVIALQSTFAIPGYDIKKLLQNLLNLPSSRKLPFEITKYASTLLSQFQPKAMKDLQTLSKLTIKSNDCISLPVSQSINGKTAVPTATTAPTAPATIESSLTPQHIMLSYSWLNNKPLIVSLGNKLRQLGYDVWRDEDGSSICPPMSGDIAESMTDAINHSYAVVICVSPEYKESVNCRAEAKYAQARKQSHNLKLVYVVVDQNYLPHSTDRVVDGWLGVMMGSEQWYPLWNEAQIDSTGKALSDLFGNNGKLTLSAGTSDSLQTIESVGYWDQSLSNNDSSNLSTKYESTPEKSSGLDFGWAWECLQPGKSKDVVALKAILEDELGVFSARDFEGVEREYYETIAVLLKPAPQKNFRKALQM